MNWLDILFISLIGWNAWTGLKTGLVAGASRLIGVLAGFAAAMSFYQPLSDAVNLKWNLVSTISKIFAGPDKSAAAGPLKAPGAPDLFFPGPAAPGDIKGLYGIGDSVARTLASGILDILSFIIIFMVVSGLISILGILVGKMTRMVFLGPVDRAGGILLGAAKGGIISTVLVGLVISLQLPAVFLSGGNKTSFLSLALQKSVMVPYFLKALEYLKIHFPGWIL